MVPFRPLCRNPNQAQIELHTLQACWRSGSASQHLCRKLNLRCTRKINSRPYRKRDVLLCCTTYSAYRGRTTPENKRDIKGYGSIVYECPALPVYWNAFKWAHLPLLPLFPVSQAVTDYLSGLHRPSLLTSHFPFLCCNCPCCC
jgi:hypothetical protein